MRGIEIGVASFQANDSINRWFAAHHGLITRSQAEQLGLSDDEIDGLLRRGFWERLHSRVYRLAASPRSPVQLLYGASLGAGAGAVASHRSAAWLWDLVDRAPPTPEISVPVGRRPRLDNVVVHRSNDLDLGGARTRLIKGIPTTDPLRTLVGFAAKASREDLTTAIDRALARRLTAVARIDDELRRLRRQGRPGIRALRSNLRTRGLIGVPHPSVLESRMMRLFVRSHLPVPKVEVVVGPQGEYRLDFSYPDRKKAIEVDGYAYHSSPEQVQRDNARRNSLEVQGWQFLVYTWLDVTRQARRTAGEISAFYGR
jgi:hypothetical protein